MSTAIVHSRTIVLRARQRELESLVHRRTAELAGATEERRALIENLAHDLRAPFNVVGSDSCRASSSPSWASLATRTR